MPFLQHALIWNEKGILIAWILIQSAVMKGFAPIFCMLISHRTTELLMSYHIPTPPYDYKRMNFHILKTYSMALLGQPKGTLFCADTVCKEINRRSGKIMESPFSGLLGRHHDNSVSLASERFAVFCCFWREINDENCLSDNASGTRAWRWEMWIWVKLETISPLRKEYFWKKFCLWNKLLFHNSLQKCKQKQ